MKTVEEVRRERLQWLVDRHQSIQALAEAIGKSHSQVSQLLRAVRHSTTGKPRTMGKVLARAIETQLGLDEGLMDTAIENSLTPPGNPWSQAQPVSLSDITVESTEPPRLEWRVLMENALPPVFRVQLPDNSMAPDAEEGWLVEFERFDARQPARPGDGVIVRDKAGGLYFRRFVQARPGSWEARASNQDYLPMESQRDGLEVVAKMRYVMRPKL